MRICWRVMVVFLCFLMLITIGIEVQAKQPYSSYWYPAGLLNWNPENDPDAKFNRGSIPLQERLIGQRVNPTTSDQAKVMAISIMYPSTSGAPSQGGNTFDIYAFSYWQYIDTLIMWGGSAGEGLILSPSADVIDVAHKNGVSVLGTVFFPPSVYGGKFEWVEQFLQQRADGSFPVADKLIEVADYYGFDGWFINQETGGGDYYYAQKMQQFLAYFQDEKSEEMQVIWYDAMDVSGRIRWQGELNDRNAMFFQEADGLFIDFRWRSAYFSGKDVLGDSSERALAMERSPYDLYAGLDVQARGTQSRYPYWSKIFPPDSPATVSLGLYCPNWTFSSSKDMTEFYQKEELFWSGINRNPAQPLLEIDDSNQSGQWPGIAGFITAKSPVIGKSFLTNFNTGHGKIYAVNGEVMSGQDWHNRSLQDVLPTWRWIVESTGEESLKPEFDWDNAYYGGSSLKIAGRAEPNSANHIKLYKTKIPVKRNTKLEIVYQTPLPYPYLQVGIAFADNPQAFTFFAVGESNPNGWTKQSVSLHKYRGQEIAAISLKIESDHTIEDYSLNIGEISINADRQFYHFSKRRHIHRPRILATDFRDGIYTDLRLEWRKRGRAAKQYEIYRIRPDQSREFLGATPNTVYYIPELKRLNKEDMTELEVVALSPNNIHGKGVSVIFYWPEYPAPQANFSVNHTLIAPDQQVAFFDLSSEVTESWQWEFAGGIPGTSTERNPVVRYPQEGVYDVTLIAQNSEGQDLLTREGLITVSTKANLLENVALQAQVSASSFVNNQEKPSFAVNGKLSDKWCAVGEPPHWLLLDLGELYHLAGFKISHAEAGNESSHYNTRAYRIEVSQNGNNWLEVVNVLDKSAGVSTDPVKVTTARYVRLSILVPTQGGDTAARIYEFEVYGYR